MNFWYVNIYGLWANIILNIISPLIGILVLNTIVYRYWLIGRNHNMQQKNKMVIKPDTSHSILSDGKVYASNFLQKHTIFVKKKLTK